MFEIVYGVAALMVFVGPFLVYKAVTGRKADPLAEYYANREPWGGRRAPVEPRQGVSWKAYVAVLLGVWMVLLLPPYLIHGMPETATVTGFTLVAAEHLGGAVAICGIGLLGRFYRPAPFTAYCIVSALVFYLGILGATAA